MPGKPAFARGAKALLLARRERMELRQQRDAQREDPAVQLYQAERAKRPIGKRPEIIAAKRDFEAHLAAMREAHRPGRKTKKAWTGPMRARTTRAQILAAIDDAALRRRCEMEY